MEEKETTPKKAGRKLKDKVATQFIALRLRNDYIKIIDDNFPNRSDFIQHAIKEKLRRECLI